MVAQAVAGQAGHFDLFAQLQHRRFPGGPLLRMPSLVLGMLLRMPIGFSMLVSGVAYLLVKGQDVGLVAETLEKGNCVLEECESQALPGQNHYVMSPQSIVQEKTT